METLIIDFPFLSIFYLFIYFIFLIFFFLDFSLPANNVDVDSHQNEQKDESIKITSAYGTHRLGSHLENVMKTDSKKGDTVEHAEEEEVQRRKVYSHLMLNPSFIPYGGHANSIRPQQGFNIENRNSTNLLGKRLPNTVFVCSFYAYLCTYLVTSS